MKSLSLGVRDTPQPWVGLFFVTMATLMYEILLTRIFSVTMWYHFAFVAISVAMFGMTLGAILVYLMPNYFTQQRARYQLTLSSLLFAISVVLSFLTHVSIPFVIQPSFIGLYTIALTYAVISIPFICSGICVCLALTKFPRQVSQLYAADLAGAAMGCVLLIYTLNLSDGPTAVMVVALCACLGTLVYAGTAGAYRLKRVAFVCTVIFATVTIANTILAMQQRPLLHLMWVKGELEPRPLYEKWNSFSRIHVINSQHPDGGTPMGWGISSTYSSKHKVKQLLLKIDSTAYTPLTAYDSPQDLEHLKYDVTNLAHYVKKDAKVLVVGAGGGRDILSALLFDQQSVVAVEINSNILDAVNRQFGAFTRHLDRNPKVTFVNEEGRSFIARQQTKFDLIQVSLIDTWAATAAGAFVLTESSLYTVEAWKLFLERLDRSGILTFSRWYFRDIPGEIYRLTSLASTSLMEVGIHNPRRHVIIVRNMQPDGISGPNGIGTILVQKEPFSDHDLNTIEEISRQMRFDVVLSPRTALDQTFATLTSGDNLAAFTAAFPYNIAAPTDDSPFFFHMLRLKDIFNKRYWEQGYMSYNMKAVFVLGSLLIVVVGLTLLCIIGPLLATADRESLVDAGSLTVFFSFIGLGFMLVEISQMQRLIVFLGHPTYGLSVVLFALLMSSGLGSYMTQNIRTSDLRRSAMVRLSLLLCVLVIFGVLTTQAIHGFQASTTIIRILAATGILLPLGFFMGMAFPLGMKLAATKSASITPWLWGVNGATSVCASVLAVVIAMTASISVAFWSGVVCYIIAAAGFVQASSGCEDNGG